MTDRSPPEPREIRAREPIVKPRRSLAVVDRRCIAQALVFLQPNSLFRLQFCVERVSETVTIRIGKAGPKQDALFGYRPATIRECEAACAARRPVLNFEIVNDDDRRDLDGGTCLPFSTHPGS